MTQSSKSPPSRHPESARPDAAKSGKYRRAKLRHFFFTTGPDRLTGGRLRSRHLAQQVEIREIEVVSPDWPEAFDGIRIGHISDLHVGDLLPVDRAIAVVEQLASLEPDFVACTGDVVDLDNSMAPPVLKALSEVPAPLGSMLVLGNHDHLDDPEELSKMAERAGLVVLRDDVAEIVHNGGRLVLGGVDWGRTVKECCDRVERITDDRLDLLLSHNPKSFRAATRLGIPLTLSGHTHGGQIARRKAPNHNLAFAHGLNRGIYTHQHSHLFVTTGVGAWFPLRINCPPEVAIVTVRRGTPA